MLLEQTTPKESVDRGTGTDERGGRPGGVDGRCGRDDVLDGALLPNRPAEVEDVG
jgi:hypothetical protein